MTDISKNTLEKIKKENVHPIPKRYFLLRRSVLWVLFGLSILLGSITSGVIIFLLTHFEWDVYHTLGYNLTGFILLVFPYFWLFFMLGFSIFAYIFFRRTEQGYKYKTVWIVLQSILFSVLGGALLYATELPERLEISFHRNIPFYRGLEDHKQKIWMSPDHGLLAGKMIGIISKEIMHLEDLNGNIWVVHTSDATWRGRLSPTLNLKIKIIGQKKGHGQFIAREIRPWEGRRQRDRLRRHREKGYF